MNRVSLFFVCILASAGAGAVDIQRQEELRNLLLQDCGSCHGMTLQGGLGPSLKPEALTGKPDAFLEHTILNGRAGVPMPPWRGILSEADVTWLVQALRKGEFHE
ncbi:MAG: cytochrome c [Hydrogenophaga sp.]